MITPSRLYELLDSDSLILIDVRLEDDFHQEHISGAVNNCVFEVPFLSRFEELCDSKNTAVCVYGASEESHESRVAVEKLERAGFTEVSELRVGLRGWKAEGRETQKGEKVSDPPILNGEKAVDLTDSKVEWLGRNLLNKHWGTIPVKHGKLQFEEGALIGGEITIDMEAIQCTDLAGEDSYQVLIDHLRSDDFFDTDRFPEAKLVIHKATLLPDRSESEPNLHLRCDLTLKDVSAPLEFEATAGITDEGKAAAQAAFSIDRTKWNVIYGSRKFFSRLAGHLVNDRIELQIKIVSE